MSHTTVVQRTSNKDLLRKYTATTSYCQHTGIKIVIGTEFQNSSLRGRFLPTEHPVFTLSAPKLIALVLEMQHKANPTEQHLLLIATLNKLGLIVHHAPFMVDTADTTNGKVWDAFIPLVLTHNAFTSNAKPIPALPLLAISEDTTGADILTYIKTITADLNSYIVTPVLSKADRLGDELDLERELKSLLSSYNRSKVSKAYNAKLGRWALKVLMDTANISDEQYRQVEVCLFSKNAHRLSSDILRSSVGLLKSIMPLSTSTRTNSLLVIRHIESKLEELGAVTADFGFTILEDEDASIKGEHGITYTTRTKSVPRLVSTLVAATSPIVTDGMTALERLAAKFGRTSKGEIVCDTNP
jgi:hypothetical protein